MISVCLLAALAIVLACSLTGGGAQPAGVEATIVELYAVQTQLVGTSQALESALAPSQPVLSGSEAPETSATNLSVVDPTETVTPAPTLIPVETTAADERLMKSASILLFEDMSASRYIRLVKEALDRAGYFYLDVGSAKGWFKTQLLSGEDWDLVIAAAEAEREFGGEFYGFLDDQLAAGRSVIIENWDLDFAPSGQLGRLLNHCGVQVQSDWSEPQLRVFYWTDPVHPLFSRPNALSGGLRNAPALWSGDLGDLMTLQPSGDPTTDAQILASLNPNWNSDHGLLTLCAGGRLVLQTFRSHEYHHDDIVALWQNYIDYTLRNHFVHTGQTAPPAAPTASAPALTTPEITHGPTPGPDYSFRHACGTTLTAQLLRYPQFQPVLFEHHALGTFMIFSLELENVSDQPIQVWDGDYSLEADLYGQPVSYLPHSAATGYLFLEGSGSLYQDLIEPGEKWQTEVAFDIDPAALDWEFVLRPGYEFNQTACEVRIPLNR